MRIRITAITDRGLARDHNEDCVGWLGWSASSSAAQPLTVELEPTEPVVVVVCDGMGGHAGGATASRIAAELLTGPGVVVDSPDQVGSLVQQVSDTINDRADGRPELAGMGCTVAGVVIHPDGSALVFNVGDSRCYRLEGDYLAQLTVDHRRAGTNTLTQALGGGRRMILEPDFFACEIPAAPGLLLCTDGLDDYADELQIEQLVVARPVDVVARLRDLALAGGGGDNVTVVQIERIGPETEDRDG